MNAQEFSTLLTDLKACEEATLWAEGKSLAVAWKTCKRGDWLLWLCGKMADKKGWPTREEVVLAACDCAELSLKYVPAGEDRPRECIELTRAWVAGTATIAEVRLARNAAYATYGYAAYAAANAAAAADAADAANAAYAAAAAAAYAAAASRTKTLAKCATMVRKRLKIGRV